MHLTLNRISPTQFEQDWMEARTKIAGRMSVARAEGRGNDGSAALTERENDEYPQDPAR